MLLFIHFTWDGADQYQVMEKARAESTNTAGRVPWLSMCGHLMTSQEFKSERDAVTYAERLLTQTNLPDAVRKRLKSFVDRFYNHESCVLDALDNEYDPVNGRHTKR